MRDAQVYLEIVRSRGERRLELRRVYRNLQNRDLFLRAYAKLYANDGALTPGVDLEDTADAMSLKRIDNIIACLKAGTYQWKPTRRAYIPKKDGRRRSLGMPGWNDKMLQEVIRTVLAAYYEPQFSDNSHGFRPGRGCHTALRSILLCWQGTSWFIEGDIRGCFDEIEQNKLLEIINRSIKDERFLKLLRGMLKAGYMDDWEYHQTYSGTPQGGVISPILANIFLNELDAFIEEELIPEYTRGEQRKANPEYDRLSTAMYRAKTKGDVERYKVLRRKRRTLPSGDPNDPGFRRLKYVRFADDFLLGFIGPKSEALEIKRRIGEFLSTLGLTMSEKKTLVTHATTGRARFLGYDVHVARNNNKLRDSRRTLNGTPLLSVPIEVANEWKRRYMRKGKAYHRAELINNSDYDIVMTYQLEFRGRVNYYKMAYNVAARLYPVKWVYLQSLVKTLSAKHKRKVTWVYSRYYRRQENGIKALVVEIPRENRRPLIAKFGAQPIRYDKWAVIQDAKSRPLTQRNEMVSRLLANQCELCGCNEDIEVHHIRKLKDLKRRYAGRSAPPLWAVRMMEIRRKTLVVCKQCHQAIHAGAYDGPKLK